MRVNKYGFGLITFLILASIACGMIDTVVNKATGGSDNFQTVSSLWSDVPQMDGLTLQKRLNALRSPLGIIFISGFASAEDREQAMALGAKGFLQKPFSEDSLLELLNKIDDE